MEQKGIMTTDGEGREMFRVRVESNILGNSVFWEGTEVEVDAIRNVCARHLVEVLIESPEKKSLSMGMWIAERGIMTGTEERERKGLLQLQIEHHGPIVTHNYPCPVCTFRYAVYTMPEGFFQPCWECQSRGYLIRKRRKWFKSKNGD